MLIQSVWSFTRVLLWTVSKTTYIHGYCLNYLKICLTYWKIKIVFDRFWKNCTIHLFPRKFITIIIIIIMKIPWKSITKKIINFIIVKWNIFKRLGFIFTIIIYTNWCWKATSSIVAKEKYRFYLIIGYGSRLWFTMDEGI